MHPSLEHIDACLPISTLKAFDLGDVRLIIEGQGPFARLFDDESGRLIADLKTFKRSNVHGFVILDHKQQGTGKSYAQLLAWGGESLRAIELNVTRSTSGELETVFQAATAEFLAPDWILAGCALGVNHEEKRAYLITAHNAVLGLNVTEQVSSGYQKSIHLQQLVAGVKTLLYSADAISFSASHLLVAAGTVFGEIIIWSCFLNESENIGAGAVSLIHHFFTGHEGSIFGVQISPEISSLHGRPSGRLLASCSDDRTIRIWDISDCEKASRDDPSAYSTDGFDLRSTGFGAVKSNDGELGSESYIASAFGHQARIWSVYFLPTQAEDQGKLNLVSRGEDTNCLVWDLNWDPSSPKSDFKLREVSSVHQHHGKQIWALALRSANTGTTVYTGGADGAMKSFKIEVNENRDAVVLNRDHRITLSVDSNGSGPDIDKSMKSIAFVSPDCFVATTTKGEVQTCWIESRDSTSYISKETICIEEDLRSYCAIAGLSQHGLALLGNARGSIRLYNRSTRSLSKLIETERMPQGLFIVDYSTSDSSTNLSFISSHAKLNTADLFVVTMSETAPQSSKITLALPKDFVVTSVSLVCGKQYLALGSQRGSLAIYQITETETSLQPLLSSQIHPHDGTSQITPLSSLFGEPEDSSNYFMTCGRDGFYSVHTLEASGDSQDSISLQTIHHSSPLPRYYIAGAYIDKISGDLMIYGFSGVDFILWNETTYSEVARTPCGGPRRTWAFHPCHEEAGAGLFIWVQSNVNVLQIRGEANRALRAGGHGREIKAMGVSPSNNERGPLFATGSEDTALRIFEPADPHKQGPWGAFKCVRKLNQHQTGFQHVDWSKNGEFLFTGTANEEFFVWRVRSIPLFGLAVVKIAASPKDEPNSDLRVTSFDMLEVEGDQAEGSFLLVLTYSNSTLKIFHFSSPNAFTLLAKGKYTGNCLTQARSILRDTSLILMTASTDGAFTLWNLAPVVEPFYSISSALHLKQPIEPPATPEDITCENRYQIHSNCIKSMELVHVSDTASLIIAGGDDNALTLSLLNTNFANAEASDRTCTVTITDAHAACVTTTKIIEQRQLDDSTIQLLVASSGNDHQVKIWRVSVDLRKDGFEAIRVENVIDRYCSVADISSLDVIQDESGTKLVVCGVGMEMMKVLL